jgi:formate hydrogenlyase subunit 3/multisubunit Na+/H+ antiporter MnhD subunit
MSFMKVTRYAFLGTIRDTLRGVKEVPAFMRLAMVGLAIVCIVGGLLLLPGVREMFLGSASSVLSGGIVLPGEMGR